ncbi:MAG: hypothetical protein IKG70_09430 [Lachnospiraceae bacterium]|nr:hypothetical protein [Lachnospiraceae bacterium]
MLDFLEAAMIFCFGISWPISIYKSVKSRTAKGKSLVFEFFIWLGYIFGIVRKVLQIQQGAAGNWLFYLALAFYILNIAEITVDMLLWVRNRKLDRIADAAAASPPR